jgi:RNA polymerase sigma factor (sigma-70 family)
MSETPETSRDDARVRPLGAAITAPEVRIWFVRQVLPLEAVLKQFLQHNWHNKADVDDLLQEVYVRVCESARRQIPEPAKPFVFTVARNLLIDRVRRERIIPIEAVSDLDALEIEKDEPGPERSVIARDELRRLQAALDRLPPRWHEAIVLKQVDGLSRREIAQRMGIAEETVKQYVADGLRNLANIFFSEPADMRRQP